jgi:hypothetical protein
MMGSSLILRGRWSEYRAYLIAETEALTPRTRGLYVRSFAMPWFAVLLVGGVLCFTLDSIFKLGEVGRTVVLGPFALVGLAGMIYSGWIIMYYGVRADVRRMNEARAKGS